MEGPECHQEMSSSWTEEGKAEQELHRSSVPPHQTPQPEMLGQGLGIETQAPEVSSGERTKLAV